VLKRRLVLWVAISATITCSDSTGPLFPQPVTRVTLSAHLDSLFVGDTLRLSAVATDARGDTVRGRHVRWKSSDSTKLSVDSAGLVSARMAGSVAITAAVDTVTGGAFVTAQWPVVAVALPDSITITRYEVVRLISAIRGPTGTQLAGREEIWASSNPAVATVSSIGVIQPQGIGQTTISLSSAGREDTSRLLVVHEPVRHIALQAPGGPPVPVGSPDTLGVTCTDTLLRDAVGAPVSWAVDTTVFRMVVTSGNDRLAIFTGLHPGSSSVRVSCGGLTDSAALVTDLVPTRARFNPDTLVIGIGQVASPDGLALDTAGGAHGPAFFSIQSLDTTIVGVMSDQVVGRKPGRARIVGQATIGAVTSSDTALVVVPADSVRLSANWGSTVSSVENYSLFIGQVTISDTAGHPLAGPRTIFLNSGDTSVGRFVPTSITTRDTGSFEFWVGHAGHTVATIRVDSVTADHAVISTSSPVASLSVAGLPVNPLPGDTATIFVNLYGRDGGARFYPAAWTLSDSSKARIDSQGQSIAQTAQTARFTALAPGRMSLTITSGTVSKTLPIVIRSASGLTVTSASATPITPGASLTLTGSGFDPTPVNDSVWIDGVPTPVTGASATTLTVAVPAAASFRCEPTHLASIMVGSGGALTIDSFPLRVGTPESLAVGGLVRLDPGTNRCTEVLNTDQPYEVAFTNPATGSDVGTSFEVVGVYSGLPASSPLTARPSITVPRAVSVPLDSAARALQAHRQLLEANRAVVRRLGSPQSWWAAAAGTARPALSVGATIGGNAHIRIPNLAEPDFCSAYIGIDARLVYSGTHSLIFEDIYSPIAGQMDSVFASVGKEFDDVDYPELLADYGNPMAVDTLLDRVGKISMVFSPQVSAFGVNGFVTSCDFYPEAAAPSSNTTEIFYGPVPTAPGTGFSAYTKDVWKWQIRSVLMHEAKHITSYAEHFSRQAPPEETWLEESSAVLAEELWARGLYHNTWLGQASYNSTLYCEVRPTQAPCLGDPFSMYNAFDFLYQFDENSGQLSPLGPTSPQDASFYGSGWSFLRWAIDHYAGSESGFLKAITQEPSLTGAANLSARTGRPLGQMLGDWQLSLMVNGIYGFHPLDPAIGFPSWNVTDVYSGMNRDFGQLFPDSYPEQLRSLEGGTDDAITLPGGATTVYLLRGFTGSYTFELRGPGGGTPPPIQLEILHIQ